MWHSQPFWLKGSQSVGFHHFFLRNTDTSLGILPLRIWPQDPTERWVFRSYYATTLCWVILYVWEIRWHNQKILSGLSVPLAGQYIEIHGYRSSSQVGFLCSVLDEQQVYLWMCTITKWGSLSLLTEKVDMLWIDVLLYFRYLCWRSQNRIHWHEIQVIPEIPFTSKDGSSFSSFLSNPNFSRHR